MIDYFVHNSCFRSTEHKISSLVVGMKLVSSRFQFAPEKLVSRDGFGSPVPRQPAHLHTQAEPVLIYGIPPVCMLCDLLNTNKPESMHATNNTSSNR